MALSFYQTQNINTLEPFLKTLAQYYYETYGNTINECCFIFPNRRSSLFFQKHLAAICTEPLFAPDTHAINELFARLSPLKQADSLGLIFSLYECYSKLSNTAETFDEFYSWGETLLADFNDIDKYLVDAEQLFSNLYELKSIDDTFDYLSDEQIEAIKHFWRDFKDYKGEGSRQSFLQSWLILAPLYKQFRQGLANDGKAYEGMMYRTIADMVKTKSVPALPYKRLVFIGLNALNKSEKLLLKYYQDRDLAHFHWDFNSDFLHDPQNKAGLFIKRNIIDFPQNPQIDFKKYPTPQFESIAIPSNTGQTKILTNILESRGIKKKADIENTAVILSDEQLMLPMLHALPNTIEAYNITMGYPLRSTAIYSFFNQLLNLQKNARFVDGKASFYHQNIVSVLRHSFTVKHFREDGQALTDHITEHNLIYAEADNLTTNTLFRHIFKGIPAAIDFPHYLKQIFGTCLELYATTDDNENTTNDTKLEKEFIYHLYITISRFNDLLDKYSIQPGIDIISRLLRKHIDTITVPFYGEPLNGLQVMGILETRTLDFENLIFLSFNEGVLPKASAVNSFIPHNLRFGFGLPTIEHQDAIFAYYFYRIAQRAKNVWMVYDSSSGGMKRSEISRYFSQLKYIYNQKIKERVQTYQIELTSPQPILIEKNGQVMEKLTQFIAPNKKMLSASALNTYIECKLKFYFHKVEGIQEQDELKEDVDNSSFGTIFHSVAEELYKPYENSTLTKDILYQLSQNDHLIDQEISKSFAKEHFKTEKPIVLKGRHLIIGRIIKKYIKQLFKVDMQDAPFIYRKGEQKIRISHTFEEGKTVNFIAFIDRLDEVNGQTRVIDYKTGTGKKMSFKDMENLVTDSNNRSGAIFQTFFYAWLIYQETGNKNLNPSVYYIRNLFKGFDPYIYTGKTIVDDFAPYLKEFNTTLETLLSDIFNPKIPFTQTENQDKCRYCNYKDICLR